LSDHTRKGIGGHHNATQSHAEATVVARSIASNNAHPLSNNSKLTDDNSLIN
jgi:hypothetical protein